MNAPYTIVVQQVATVWYKKERGGAQAVLRNAVPDVLEIPIPYKVASEPTFLNHSVYYRSPIFDRPYRSRVSLRSPSDFKGYTIQLEDEFIKIVFDYPRKKNTPSGPYPFDPSNNYFPGRQGILTVRPGQWVQFLENARYRNWPDEGNRTFYVKEVVNIGLFLELTPTVLIEREPAHVINRLKQIR